MAIYYSAKGQVNHHRLQNNDYEKIVTGNHNVCTYIRNLIELYYENQETPCLIALDGYLGVEWNSIIKTLAEILNNSGISSKTIDINSYLEDNSTIQKIFKPYLNSDPDFGHVFDGNYEMLFNLSKIEELIKELGIAKEKPDSPWKKVVICYGSGAVVNQVLATSISPAGRIFDYVIYFDITRQELFNRSEKNPVYLLGHGKGTDTVHDSPDRFWYFDSGILDRHKKNVLRHIDFYVDSTDMDELKMIPKNMYEDILSSISKSPIMMKQLYYATSWGGVWQKNLKNLPDSLINSGQGQLVPNDNSIEIEVGSGNKTFSLDIPFLNIMWQESKSILGKHAFEVGRGEFPLCYFYDDEIDGGNMAIQVHPDEEYMKNNFNELGGQDETYYILHTGEDAKTYIGLTEDADIDELKRKAVQSRREGTKIDFEKYINSVNTKPHDFLLIPAGTIHASGRNQVVVEIDWVSTSYTPGYTFHIYDYLRPDLDGTLRTMHIDHAFNMLKDRRKNWVMKNLKQKPDIIRSGDGYKEYLIGKRDDMLFETHRLEFEKRITDKTQQDGTFHALTLVEGESVIIRSQKEPDKKAELQFPDTIIVPASMGEYVIINQSKSGCKIVKAMVK